MKAVVSKVDLVSMIRKIQSVLSTKPAIPVLANILFEAFDDQMVLSATDLTVSIRCILDAKVIEEGAIALPGRKMAELTREVGAPQIKISSTTTEIAEITTGTSHFKVHGMNKGEFPALPDLTGAHEVRISSSSLKDLLSKTAFSAAREDSRYMLNGVQMTLAGNKLSVIGTDGKRLAKTSSTVLVDGNFKSQCVIPLKAVEEMIRLLEDTDNEVSLSFATDKIALEAGHQTLIAKLLSGQYPDVERVIPSQPAHQFAIHREELMSLLRQVSLFTSESSNSVRFTFETGQLHLYAMSSDIGEGRVSMPVDFAGPRLDIAFNPFYFLDILRHSKEETVKFALNDAHNPGLVTDSTQSIFVIMPMRLSDLPTMREPEAATTP